MGTACSDRGVCCCGRMTSSSLYIELFFKCVRFSYGYGNDFLYPLSSNRAWGQRVRISTLSFFLSSSWALMCPSRHMCICWRMDWSFGRDTMFHIRYLLKIQYDADMYKALIGLIEFQITLGYTPTHPYYEYSRLYLALSPFSLLLYSLTRPCLSY